MTVLIHLPVFYNPDRLGRRRRIEDEKFVLTAEEVAEKFHGGVLHKFSGEEARGSWWNKGIVYRDVLALLEVDVPDTAESRRWLRTYARDVLIRRFRQKAMYMKLIRPVEDLLVSEVTVSEKEVKAKR